MEQFTTLSPRLLEVAPHTVGADLESAYTLISTNTKLLRKTDMPTLTVDQHLEATLHIGRHSWSFGQRLLTAKVEATGRKTQIQGLLITFGGNMLAGWSKALCQFVLE